MITSFAHKGLEDFFYDGSKRGIQPRHAQRLADILDRLDAAQHVSDMRYPGSDQGHLVFQCNPDESQRLYRLGSQPTACCCNVRMACPPQQANRGVA
jgi:plasmid maintenance system killer protein